ncbi:MAG: hypothetical protein PWQ57_1693 [Desulfovibrionales bacterium]|nr:hypothetical protein [Desulfovibrionales bacterium]
MRLQVKVNIICLAVLTIVVCSAAAAGVWTIDRLAYDLNRKLLASEVDNVLDRIRESYDVLETSGVSKVASYVKSAQDELVANLVKSQRRFFGRIMILEGPGRVVFNESQTPPPLDAPCIRKMILEKEGDMECRFNDKDRFFFYRTFTPWGWLVVLSVSTDEMFAMRSSFLANSAIILTLGLFLGGLALVWFMRSVVGPVQQLAETALAISKGDWDRKPIVLKTEDEISELAHAFSLMAKELQTAQSDLKQQARELRTANANLTQEVAVRSRAERELYTLNRDLERLVQQRTADLVGKADELEAANKKLLEMDEIKSAFLNSVSHELRTPLTSVLGFTKLISRDFIKHFDSLSQEEASLRQQAKRILDNLKIIEHEGERLTRMINEFLDLTRIESGRVEWSDRDLCLDEILRQTVNSVGGLFAQKPQIRLVADIPDDLPRLYADPDRLEQVFINLLNNAAKFTHQGSVTITAREVGNDVYISVADTGEGIPQEELDKIFDKFHQVRMPDTREQKPPGTGLGLAICKQIATHYGGDIQVESRLGRGSVFTVTLPAFRQNQAALQDATEFLDGEGPLILVVDDEPAIRTFLSQFLHEAGYRVFTAPDGPSALEKARRLRPDLVTLDIMMPGMSGREVISRMRRDPELAHAPILVITMLREFQSNDVEAALAKPIDEALLLDTVHSLLNRRSASRPAIAMTRNGPEDLSPYMALAQGEILHCREEEMWRRIKAGFEGAVILPAWAARVVDLSVLAAYEKVHLIILPDPQSRGEANGSTK